MQCAEHPNVETNLRCGKCDKPICPKCMVQTPVGARCKACARLKRLPIFEVSSSQYVLAIGLGIGLAIVAGAISAFIAIPFISFWIPLAAGYLIGEAISRAVNRKRSVGLQVIVGFSVFGSYIFSRMVPYLFGRFAGPGVPLDPVTIVQLGSWIVVGTLTQPYSLLILALGIYLGVTRVR